MAKTMLSEALREAFGAVRGPLDQLNANLGGEDGEEWLTELKRFLRKEPTWVSPGTLVARAKATLDKLNARAKPSSEIIVTPYSDTGLPLQHYECAQNWRKLAKHLGYIGWRKDPPMAWDVVQNGGHQIVFWIPKLILTRKNLEEQMELLAGLRQCFNLSGHHLTTLGSCALLDALIKKYFQLTGQQVPSPGLRVRTDNCSSESSRFDLGWDEGAPNCGICVWDGSRRAEVGVFALGVELAF